MPKAGWAAVASFPNAAMWHAAQSVLAGQGIVCRVGDTTGSSDGSMVLEVFGTEAEWVRELLGGGVPSIVGLAAPPGGFPITALPPEVSRLPTGASPGAVRPAAPVHALPVAPLRPIDTSRSNRRYRLIILFLWMLMILTIAAIVLVCWFGNLEYSG
jgi:hypothetical protein